MIWISPDDIEPGRSDAIDIDDCLVTLLTQNEQSSLETVAGTAERHIQSDGRRVSGFE
jgi:hypothetical protein